MISGGGVVTVPSALTSWVTAMSKPPASAHRNGRFMTRCHTSSMVTHSHGYTRVAHAGTGASTGSGNFGWGHSETGCIAFPRAAIWSVVFMVLLPFWLGLQGHGVTAGRICAARSGQKCSIDRFQRSTRTCVPLSQAPYHQPSGAPASQTCSALATFAAPSRARPGYSSRRSAMYARPGSGRSITTARTAARARTTRLVVVVIGATSRSAPRHRSHVYRTRGATPCGIAPLTCGDAGGRYWDRTSDLFLSLIHISEPTRLGMISYAVFCL